MNITMNKNGIIHVVAIVDWVQSCLVTKYLVVIGTGNNYYYIYMEILFVVDFI